MACHGGQALQNGEVKPALLAAGKLRQAGRRYKDGRKGTGLKTRRYKEASETPAYGRQAGATKWPATAGRRRYGLVPRIT
jgi:hypothetical protein